MILINDEAISLFGMPKTVYATVSNQRQLKETDVADDFTIILGYENSFKAILRSSMLSRHTPVLRFNLRGMNGGFRKEYLDVQEDQLKAGLVPTDAGYGVESSDRYGCIDTEIGGVHIVGKVDTQNGDYLSFYNNVGEAIIKSDASLLAVKPEDGANCIRIIELAKQSSDEGKVIVL
jgi:predicted dehydrogenase